MPLKEVSERISMIRSMTGYGRKEAGDDEYHFTVEVRSLNNRYLDIQLKAPRGLLSLESRIKKLIQERFSRGRFDVAISRNGSSERQNKLLVDEQLASQYVGALKDLKTRFALAGDIDISAIAAFPDIVRLAEAAEDPEALWKALLPALTQSLEQLDVMRIAEGGALVLDIKARLDLVNGMTAHIRSEAPNVVDAARKRMQDTLTKLMDEQPDPVRLAQEIAILAERTDVTEELTRLASHMRQFSQFLDDRGKDPVGRKLDFLLQEMGREVNTIGSKAMDTRIAMDVVNAKAELEKIREQVQNIE
jgi:uncharacterized protein (TIGR00255 family)